MRRSSLYTLMLCVGLPLLVACAGVTPEDEVLRDSEETPFEDYWVLEEADSPELPADLAEETERALIVLRLTVGREGRVDEIQLVDAEPAREDLIEAVVAAVREFRYAPTEENAERRPMITEYSFEFFPEESSRSD